MTNIESTFYCHDCADALGLLRGLHPVSSSPSTYQYEKALKHTRPAALSTGDHSVLNSGSTAEYQSLEQLAYERGVLEVERSGVRTLIVQTSAVNGTLYNNGSPVGFNDSFLSCFPQIPVEPMGTRYHLLTTQESNVQIARFRFLPKLLTFTLRQNYALYPVPSFISSGAPN